MPWWLKFKQRIPNTFVFVRAYCVQGTQRFYDKVMIIIANKAIKPSIAIIGHKISFRSSLLLFASRTDSLINIKKYSLFFHQIRPLRL